MNPLHKVYAYITHRRRLLVFAHPNSPEAGIQVPGGSVELDEDPEAAVLREAKEETGLPGLRLIRALGEDYYDMRQFGREEIQHRCFYHLACDSTPAETWIHGEFDRSGRLLHPFHFFWANLPLGVPPLIAGHGDRLPDLIRSLANTPD
jgi:8-oxo-dGTP pyrophosphatase MutT (NUDIX family)